MDKRIGIGAHCALAFGFTWQAIDPLESQGSQRKKLMQQGMRWEAAFSLGDVEYLGASKEDFTPIAGVKTVAGAAQMAHHPRLAGRTVLIIMEEPGDGGHTDVAVVGLFNGAIIIDDYAGSERARELRAEFAGKCKLADKGYAVVGRSFTQGPVEEQFNWSDFRPARARSPLARLRRKAQGMPAVPVRALEPKISPLFIWAALGGVALLAAFWGYSNYRDTVDRRLASAKASALRNSGPKRYADAVAGLLTQPVLPAGTLFAAVRHGIQDYPTERKGWLLRDIDCTLDTGCVATWENSRNLGDFRSFVDGVPPAWGTVTLSRSGVLASHRMPLELPARPLPAREAWPQERDFMLKQFSQWQKYWVLKFQPTLANELRVVGLPSGIPENVVAGYADAAWGIRWSIKTTPWDLSEGFDNAPEKQDGNLPDSVTVEHLKIRFERDQTVMFTAEGQVYVRK